MGKTVLAIIGVLLALLVVYYVFETMSYNEPHRTIVYCLGSTSGDANRLREALEMVAAENRLKIADESYEVASGMDRLEQARPETVLHGNITRDGELIVAYSNLGTNDLTFHLSFFSKDHESISQSFDRAIRGLVTPIRTETFSGGGFDDRICAGD
jgi:hypothetical protein